MADSIVYAAGVPKQKISSILKRARDIHGINNPKITLIQDLTLSGVTAVDPPDVPTVFDNVEGRCALAAIREYSNDVPLRMAKKIAFNGTTVYFLPTIVPGWDPNCAIEKIQYPISDSDDNDIDPGDWSETLDPATSHPILRFKYQLTSDFCLWASYPHMYDIANNLTSVPAIHIEAVAQLQASLVIAEAATIAAGFGDKQVFENKDMGALAERLQARVEKHKAEYDRIIGKNMDSFGPHFCEMLSPVPKNQMWRPGHPGVNI